MTRGPDRRQLPAEEEPCSMTTTRVSARRKGAEVAAEMEELWGEDQRAAGLEI